MEDLNKKQNQNKDATQNLESKEKIIPKIEFVILSFEGELGLMQRFVSSKDTSFRKKLYTKSFPGLYDEVKDNKDWDFRKPIFEKYLKEKRNKRSERVANIKKGLEAWVKEKGSEYLSKLSKFYDYEFKSNIKVYINNVMLGGQYNPSENSVFIYSGNNYDEEKTLLHEITHIPLWFKIKNLFEELENTKDFLMAGGTLQWKISEILVPLIMSQELEVKDNYFDGGGHKFLHNTIKDKKVFDYFTKIYLDSRNAGDSFDVTMKKIYEEAKFHEKELDF